MRSVARRAVDTFQQVSPSRSNDGADSNAGDNMRGKGPMLLQRERRGACSSAPRKIPPHCSSVIPPERFRAVEAMHLVCPFRFSDRRPMTLVETGRIPQAPFVDVQDETAVV